MPHGPRFLLALALSVVFLGVIPAVAPVGPVQSAAADAIRDREYWLNDYGIEAAWETTRGAGVTVAVIDTGINGDVRDLDGAVIGGTDVSGIGSADGQTPVGTDSDHATMVASLLAGRGTSPGNGIIGVAPEASLLSVSVALGDGATGTDAQIAKAVRWAVDNGATVINMSLTRNSLDWPTSWDEAFLYAAQHDVVVVAAAGNRGSGTSEVGAPATMPGVLTVAGVDRSQSASFDASSQGITIGVSAPSEQLVGVTPRGGYVIWEGTSGATPLVSGVVALVRAAHPELDAANVINRIISTAKPVGSPIPGPIYGYGLIDAEAAVASTVARVESNPLGDLAAWVATYRPAAGQTDSGPAAIPAPSATAAAAAESETGPIWPGIARITSDGIPIAVFSVFLVVLGLIIAAAVVRFRRAGDKD
jgi:type VII secretion-associated serine protease mycosin